MTTEPRLLVMLRYAVPLCVFVVCAAHTAVGQDDAAVDEINYTTKEWEFSDVNVATVARWVRRVGLSVPVELEGQVSGKLTVEIPWGALLDSQAWRLRGSLTSAQFVVDGHSLKDVELHLRFREGVLYLDELQVHVPSPTENQPEGLLTGTAAMELDPRGRFTASLEAIDLPLDALPRTFPALQPLAGSLSGALSADVEVDRLREIVAWKISGPVRLDALSVRELSSAEVSLQLALENGVVSASEFEMTIGPSVLTGEARLALTDEQSWSVDAKLATDDLSHLAELLAEIVESEELSRITQQISAETFQGTAHLEGTLAPRIGRITGHIALDRLRLTPPAELQLPTAGPILVERIALDYALPKPDQLELTNIRATILEGNISGDVMLTLGAAIGGSGALNVQSINLGELARLFGAPRDMVAGHATGDVRLSIPAGALNQREKWEGTASLMPRSVDIYDWQLRQFESIDLELQEGRLVVSNIAAELDGEPIAGAFSIGLQAPWNLTAQLALQQMRVDRLMAIPQLGAWRQHVDGRIDLTVDIAGTWIPLQLTGKGKARADDLRFDEQFIDELEFGYELRPESLVVSNLDATLYDGNLTGELSLPLSREQTASAFVAWQGVEAGRLLGEFVTVQARLEGKTTGNAKVTIPANAWSDFVQWDIDSDLQLDELKAGGAAIASIRATLSQHDGQLDYSATGSLFNGSLQIGGSRNQTDNASGLAALGEAQLSLRRADVGKAAGLITVPGSPVQFLAGSFNVNVSTSATAESWSWFGDLQVSDVHLAEREISSGLRLNIAGTERTVQVESLTGSVAGGQLGGSGVWHFERARGRTLRIRLRRADAGTLAQLGGYTNDPFLRGPMDLELRVHPDRTWRIAGTVGMGHGEFYDLGFRNARLSAVIDWNPGTGRMQIVLSSGSAALARGRITGRLTARRDVAWTIDGDYRFYRVDLPLLLRELGSQSSYGNGRLTGTLSISGRHVRSLADVQATLRADLEDTQAKGIPVVNEMARFVPGFSLSGATRFDEGRLEARLLRGVVQLDNLFLASRQVQIYMSGRINLSGRLRLKAVVATGQLGSPVLADTLLSQIAAVPAAPVAMLQTANDFLSNRVIHLDIHGTLSHPIIRPRPFQSLPQEAVRFFLRRATGGVASGASAAGSDSTPN